MAAPAPLNTNASLVSTFGSFLTVAIHTILYERSIYAEASFLSARKYNFPVRQNRHPGVCSWINDAVAAVEAELLKGTVSRVAVVIYSPKVLPLERFMFDVSGFPSVPEAESLTAFEETAGATNAVDLEEQLRGAMSKLAYCGSSLGKLPECCSFTVAIELKDEAERPLGHPQPWVASVPSLQVPAAEVSARIETDRSGTTTTSVRTVEAGEFILELWIEEGLEKKRWKEEKSSAKTETG